MPIILVHIGTQALVLLRKASCQTCFKFVIRVKMSYNKFDIINLSYQFIRLLDHTHWDKLIQKKKEESPGLPLVYLSANVSTP